MRRFPALALVTGALLAPVLAIAGETLVFGFMAAFVLRPLSLTYAAALGVSASLLVPVAVLVLALPAFYRG